MHRSCEASAHGSLSTHFRSGHIAKGARALAAVLRDGEESKRAARALAEREFGLEAAVARYDRLYRGILAATVKVLGLVPYAIGQAPGQRYRMEQWAPYLAERGVEIEFSCSRARN